MAWIKRNLYFVIGSAVAVVLMGLAGFYLYSKWDLNNQILTDLDGLYGELNNLNQQNPHPGSGKVDNIKAAKEQRQQLVSYVKKTRGLFERLPAIPSSTNLTDREFSPALSRTIAQLQRDATNASVNLSPKYAFSFQAQMSAFNFPPGSLQPLAVQLGEVKGICDVLYRAKINWLDSIRREMVSTNDALGTQTDYLTQTSVTNDLAVLSPYEVTFRCFSSELAAVLAGFASSPNGILVQTINVEPAPAATLETMPTVPQVAIPTPQMVAPPPIRPMEDAFAARYGGGARRYAPPAPVVSTVTVAPGSAAPTARGALTTVLDEKLLKVTLTLQVVKLLPPK
jgi:hypothetical protein